MIEANKAIEKTKEYGKLNAESYENNFRAAVKSKVEGAMAKGKYSTVFIPPNPINVDEVHKRSTEVDIWEELKGLGYEMSIMRESGGAWIIEWEPYTVVLAEDDEIYSFPDLALPEVKETVKLALDYLSPTIEVYKNDKKLSKEKMIEIIGVVI